MTEEWAGHPRGSRDYRRLLAALFLAGIATFAQLWSAQGILPLIAVDLQIDAATAGLTVSGTTAGLAAAVLPWSWVADRIGRLAVMRIALVSASVLGLLAPLAPTAELLIATRMIEGVALGGLPAVALTYLSEEVDRRHAAVAAATYVAGTSVGGLLGRIVSAPVAALSDWRAGLAVIAALATVAAIAFIALAPRARGFVQSAPTPPRAVVGQLAHLARDPVVLALWAQGALLMGALVATYTYLGFHLEQPPFGVPPALASLLFTAYLAGTASARAAGGFAERHGRRRVLIVSGSLVAVGSALTVAPALIIVVLGLVVLTIGFFAGHAVASGWVGQHVRQSRAQATSIYTLSYYAGSSLAAVIAGGLYLAFGWTAVVALVTLLGITAVVVAVAAAHESGRASSRATAE